MHVVKFLGPVGLIVSVPSFWNEHNLLAASITAFLSRATLLMTSVSGSSSAVVSLFTGSLKIS